MAPVKDKDLVAMRHSLAHIMAAVIQKLWPKAKFGVGPVIEDGFYYDIDLGNKTLRPEDLPKIEAEMAKIIKADLPFEQFDLKMNEAADWAKKHHQTYKEELLRDLQQKGTTAVKEAGSESLIDKKVGKVSFYRVGDFEDLCRGPHLKSTGQVGAFKLHKIAGAYWRGSEKNPMLQRVYGVAFATQKQVDEYFAKLDEAEQRDHRRLGRELDLFSFPDELGAGLAVWHPRGGVFRKALEDYIRRIHLVRGYQLVVTPHLARAEMWQISGHLDKFAESMYPAMKTDAGDYYIKPMNCPFHVLIYKSQTRSYRDLPLRLAELGSVYRLERPGVLHGLLRARSFTQDDSHIICSEDQLTHELIKVFDLTLEIFGEFGFKKPIIRLSTKPGQAIGNEEAWRKATQALKLALDKAKFKYEMAEGEGAFYGPKIDFHFHDAIGRLWQLTTIQVDFALPERFDLKYSDAKGRQVRPVMIHRAILGSIERFSAVLIEHYRGAFPVWLAPEQVRVITVNDKQATVKFAQGVRDEIKTAKIRTGTDFGPETVNKKIRQAELMKIPYVLVMGEKEVKTGKFTPRVRQDMVVKHKTQPIGLKEFIQTVVNEIKSHVHHSSL